jgi:arylsulfatase A-like enzyme
VTRTFVAVATLAACSSTAPTADSQPASVPISTTPDTDDKTPSESTTSPSPSTLTTDSVADSVVEPTTAVGSESAASAVQPNVLLVIADDFGIDASPCYDSVAGAEKPNMPTLESLCDTGVVFDNMTVNPECTPTRSALLTGRYGVHTGVGAADTILPTTEISIQSLLTDQGYASAVIGKWHLAGSPNEATADHATQLGVLYYAGYLSGQMSDYYDWQLDTSDGATTQQTGYATTVFADMAIDWIAGNQEQPWFTWLAYTAPHAPFHLPPADLQTRNLSGDAQDITDNPMEYYFAAAEAMDTELGRLLDSMPTEEREQTTVIFVGDNGSPRQVVQGYAADQAKGTVYEGGTHVPLVVAGAGVDRGGERDAALINGTDLFATIAELAGAESASTDSISFASLLASGGSTTREVAYTELFGSTTPNGQTVPDAWAIRNSQYRMIQFVDGATELYDLSVDPLETTDLLADPATAEASAAIVDELTAAATSIRS